jgi:hypothetical protein
MAACQLAPSQPAPSSTFTLSLSDQGLSADEIATLTSLEQIDNYPLYTMHYADSYTAPVLTGTRALPELAFPRLPGACQANWGCSLFAALGDPRASLYGRNFDWRFSPALLLFTDPSDGYASVSMVDIDYLGFPGEVSKHVLDLPLDERKRLLEAPLLPFDGMNDQGLAVGMAAVLAGDMQSNPGKQTIGELGVIREILDHAGTVDEAVNILSSYNIDMRAVPIHYLVASAAGDAALVEFYQGEMHVFRNTAPWLLATNFLVASTASHPEGQCPRYDRLNQTLLHSGGKLTSQAALSLLAEVSQEHPQEGGDTQWSIVYDMKKGDIHIVMGREYEAGVHTLKAFQVQK